MQIAYITGLFDMYEYARDELAPDPDDWIWPCLGGIDPEELREMFVDFLLNDPASWRLSPAILLMQAMEEFCGR